MRASSDSDVTRARMLARTAGRAPPRGPVAKGSDGAAGCITVNLGEMDCGFVFRIVQSESLARSELMPTTLIERCTARPAVEVGDGTAWRDEDKLI